MEHRGIVATVDRIELDEQHNRFAVLVFDDAQQLIVPAERLPEGCRAGTVVGLQFQPDEQETSDRLTHVRELQRRLFGEQSGPSSDENRESH